MEHVVCGFEIPKREYIFGGTNPARVNEGFIFKVVPGGKVARTALSAGAWRLTRLTGG